MPLQLNALIAASPSISPTEDNGVMKNFSHDGVLGNGEGGKRWDILRRRQRSGSMPKELSSIPDELPDNHEPGGLWRNSPNKLIPTGAQNVGGPAPFLKSSSMPRHLYPSESPQFESSRASPSREMRAAFNKVCFVYPISHWAASFLVL